MPGNVSNCNVPSIPRHQACLCSVQHVGVLRGSVLAARCLSLLSALRVRLDDASVWGVLDTDWLWLFLTAPSPWLPRDVADTALMRDWGRWCEFAEEAVGGGMGEGRSWLLLLLLVAVLEKEGWV
jgi:hypothetical protein